MGLWGGTDGHQDEDQGVPAPCSQVGILLLPTEALGRRRREPPRLSNSYASLFPHLFRPTHLMCDALSAVVDDLLETFGEFHLYQRMGCRERLWKQVSLDPPAPPTPPRSLPQVSRSPPQVSQSLTQSGPLLQVADEVLHVPGHVFCIL